MSCNLSHKLPWDQIRQLYIKSRNQARERHGHRYPGWYFMPSSPQCADQVRQFARRFVQLLQEFRATDMSTDEEMEQYDPEEWGGYFGQEHPLPSHHRRAGYYESLLWAYLELNLLLADPEGIRPVMMVWNCFPFALGVALGRGESGHPLHLVRLLSPAFPRCELAPLLTPQVLQILRNHAAIMFRCMYSVSGENKLLDQHVVEALLFEFFDWQDPKTVDWQADHSW